MRGEIRPELRRETAARRVNPKASIDHAQPNVSRVEGSEQLVERHNTNASRFGRTIGGARFDEQCDATRTSRA